MPLRSAGIFTQQKKYPKFQQKELSNSTCSERSTIGLPYSLSNAVSLSPNDKIISGADNIISACNYLLDLAINTPSQTKNKIYFTHFNGVYFKDKNNAEIHRFNNLLSELLKNRWEIYCLTKLTDDVLQITRLIDFFKPLIKTDNFYLYYTNDYDLTYVGKDYFIVSELGAISSFSHNSEYNTAFYLRTPSATAILENYFDFVTSYHSGPLFKYYPPKKSLDFFSCLTESETTFGNRILYKDCFGVLTFPFNLYKKILKKNHLPPAEIEKALDLYRIRLQAFEKNVIANRYHDIYPAGSLKNLLKNYHLYLYDHNGVSSVSLDLEDIVEFLSNLIHLLDTYKNYHITFLPDLTKHSWSGSINFNCLVKEREAVFITEMINSFKYQHNLKLYLEEPVLVHAFEIYFRNLLRKVSPILKNKEKEIAWLRRQSEILAGQLKN